MESLSSFLEKVFNHLSKIAIFLLFVVMVIEVIFRYIPGLHMAQPWVPGILSLLDVWLIFLASVVAMKSDKHLRISFFTEKMSPEKKEWNNLIVNIITLGLLALLTFYSIPIVRTGMDLIYFGGGELALSKGYSFLALPICTSAMAVMVLQRIVHSLGRIRMKDFHA